MVKKPCSGSEALNMKIEMILLCILNKALTPKAIHDRMSRQMPSDAECLCACWVIMHLLGNKLTGKKIRTGGLISRTTFADR